MTRAAAKPRKPGRPKLAEARTRLRKIRLTPTQDDRYSAEAETAGLSFSAWAVEAFERAFERALPRRRS